MISAADQVLELHDLVTSTITISFVRTVRGDPRNSNPMKWAWPVRASIHAPNHGEANEFNDGSDIAIKIVGKTLVETNPDSDTSASDFAVSQSRGAYAAVSVQSP